MCIKLHFYLIIWLVYLYGAHKLKTFLLFYLFALLHEIAHIIIAILLKVKIKEILLLPVGVCAKYDYIEQKKKEILIAVAGPLFSIIMALCINDTLLRNINFVIAILNLIPIYPLDGGRILRGILDYKIGYKKSVVYCHMISKGILMIITILAVALLVYFHNASLLFLSIYVFMLIEEENKKERIRETLYEIIGDN